MSGNTVCALNFAGVIFRGFAIFAFFAFLFAFAGYSGVEIVADIRSEAVYLSVYGTCRGANLLDS